MEEEKLKTDKIQAHLDLKLIREESALSLDKSNSSSACKYLGFYEENSTESTELTIYFIYKKSINLSNAYVIS